MPYIVRKSDAKGWLKKKNPFREGCLCAECKKFIDFGEEVYIHKVIKRLVMHPDCKKGIKKYRNTPRQYNNITYHSTLEARTAAELDLKIKAGVIKSWKRQVKIPLNVKFINIELLDFSEIKGLPVLTDEPELVLKALGIPFYHIGNYFIDFVITHNDESLEYLEVKGMELEVWKMKWMITQAILRDRGIKLTVVK